MTKDIIVDKEYCQALNELFSLMKEMDEMKAEIDSLRAILND